MTELPILLLDSSLRVHGALLPQRGGRWQRADAAAIPPGQPWVAVVFTPMINIHWLSVPARARETWRQACRYSLEDVLANDLEGVHVALPASLKRAQAAAAVVSANWLKSTLSALQAQGLNPVQIYPAQALLEDGESALLKDLGVRLRRQQNFAALMPSEIQLPDWIGGDEAEFDLAADWLLTRALRVASAPELMTGEFARAVPKSQSQPGTWRWAAAVAAIALALLLGSRWVEVLSLQRTEQRLDAQMQALLTQALGAGSVRIPGSERQQVENELARRQGGNGAGALGLLVPVATALNRQTQVRINAFNFREGALELTLEAPDVRSFDTLKEQLALVPGLRPSLGELSYGKATVTGRMRVEPAS